MNAADRERGRAHRENVIARATVHRFLDYAFREDLCATLTHANMERLRALVDTWEPVPL